MTSGASPPTTTPVRAGTLPLFALAIFLAAALLFVVQPLAGKIILPLLGGSPAVWNACMLFFQAALLAGYLYAHVLSKMASIRRQAFVHLVLLAAAVFTLPFPIDVGVPSGLAPTLWVLRTLAITVGPAFVLVSTSGPLLQRWFSRTNHPSAGDPYFLYAASNAGSALGLLAYPFLIEPRFTRAEQSDGWRWAFLALLAAIAGCAWLASAAGDLVRTPQDRPAEHVDASVRSRSPRIGDRLLWLCLAAVPSSLMLGVTQHITTDLAAVPLFWIIPLFLYLVTFIIAFARRRPSARMLSWVLAFLAIAIVTLMILSQRRPMWAVLTVHLATFFVATLMCHTRLADRRPTTDRLTEYYLLISVGGVVGGCINALLAPLVFNSIAEYSLMIGAACLLRPQIWSDLHPRPDASSADGRRDLPLLLRRLMLSLLVATLIASVCLAGEALHRRGRLSSADADVLRAGVPALLCIVCLFWRGSPRFALSILALAACAHIIDERGTILRRDRTFFGVHSVTRSLEAEEPRLFCHRFTHGTTIHGEQLRPDNYDRTAQPSWRRRDRMLFDRGAAFDDVNVRLDREQYAHLIPGTYYHPTGPLGDAVHMLQARTRTLRAAFVGLGTGTTAAYARPGSTFTYFEIDPSVVSIARDPQFFTYITDATTPPGTTNRRPVLLPTGGEPFLARFSLRSGESATPLDQAPSAVTPVTTPDAGSSDADLIRDLETPTIRFVLGDGRLQLSRTTLGPFDLIVLDAFTSDAIPVHLLTLEAIQTYVKHLAPGGVIAVHISNRYFDLEPVLAAAASQLQLVALLRDDRAKGDEAHEAENKFASTWIMLARDEASMSGLDVDASTPRWRPLEQRPHMRVWTDDYTNPLAVLLAK